MQFEKMKLKNDDIRLFNMEVSIEEAIKNSYQINDESNQIIMTIIKEEEFTVINQFIDTLDFSQDFVMWIMYPKGTSKDFKGIVEVNRDDVRTKINDKVRTVSMVSIDTNWSAMRLRNKVFSK